MKTIGKIIIGLLLLYGLMTAINSKEQETQTQTGGIATIKTDKKDYTVDVYFKNNTGKKLESITIIADCYDENNINIGQKKSYERNINIKDTYKTTIYYLTPEVKNCKISYTYQIK